MMNLRQGRWPRWCLLPQGAFSVGAAAALSLELGVGLLLPGAAGAMVPTRNHRPLPTKLHAASVSSSGGHVAGKHGKGSAPLLRTQGTATHGKGKGSAAAHAASGAHSGSSRASAAASATHARGTTKKKGRKSRRQGEDDNEPVIPMFHARGGRAPLAHTHGHSFSVQPVKGYGVAAGKGRHVAGLATPPLHTRDQRHASEAFQSARALEPSRPPAQPASHLHHDVSAASTRPVAPPVVAAPRSSHEEVYAQGVSHPDDDERLPRVRNAPEDDGETAEAPVAPVVRLAAPPPGTPLTPSPKTPLVQGFGGEVAVPSNASPATDRPGGTRRRSHPSTWQPDALASQSEPLEEREAMLDAAVSPAVLPEVYDRGGHYVMPAPLRGSRDVLVHQNVMALNDGLDKIYDDAALDRMRSAHLLVGFPVSESLHVNPDLPWNRRLARPWTVAFTTEIARAFYAKFHEPLQVNSAVRTVRYQAHLQMVNGNAAGTYGEAASPHLTGQAIDLAKRGMSQAELAWMRDTLLPLMRSGKIDVEEEFQQACFHISVYRSFAASRRTAQVAQVRGSAADPGDSQDR